MCQRGTRERRAALHDSIHGANRHAQGSSLDDHIVIQRAHLVHTCTAKRHSPLHSKTLGSEEVAHALVVFVGVRVDDPDFTRIRTQTPSSSQSSPSEGATITAPMTMVVFTNGTGQSALQVLRQKARQRRPWRRHKNTSAGRSVGV